MRFDHRLALRIAPLLLAALVALTPPAHAQDSRRAADPVIIREHVALPPSAPDAALFGAPRTEDLVAPDGSRIRMVVTPAVGASRTRRATNAAQPLLHAPKASERRLGHPPALGPLPTYEKRRPEPGGARLDGEHAPFSTDPYGAGGTCSPLAPSVFPSDGGLFFYQTQFAGTPAYSGALSLAVYYNGAYLGLVPISDDPPSAPPVFWDEAVSAGGLLQVRSVYEYGGQSFAGDYFTVSNVAQFESYETDGIWYGGLITQIYHPTPGGGYEFIFGVGYELRLAPALASFRVAADPDTLGLGAEAIVGIEPIDADSAVLRLPSTTELSLSLDGAVGLSENEGFGLLRFEPTDPEGQDEIEREFLIVPLEAICEERLALWAAERMESEPPVLTSVRNPLTGTRKWVIQKKPPLARTDTQRELPPDVIAIDVELFPSNWGLGGQGEGEAVVETSAKVLRQNANPIPTTGPDAYLMVSKVRPDWLLPTGAQPFAGTGYEGNTPFPNVGVASDNTHYDPDTYRLQVSGVPNAFAASELRLWLDLENAFGGPVPILKRGREGEDVLSRATYEVVCEDQGDETQICRSKQFVRLVSNARPQTGAFTVAGGRYDDEVAGLQTIRTELLDQVRMGVQVLAQEGNTDVVYNLGPVLQGMPVGQLPTFASDDAVREASLAWFTYADGNGNRLPSAPGTITDRMSEDWAQASVRYAMSRPPVDVQAEDAKNVVFLGLPKRTGRAGTLRAVISTASGPQPVTTSYEAGRRATAVATALSNDIRAVSGAGVKVFYHEGRGTRATAFLIVMEGAELVEASSDDEDADYSSAEELLRLEDTKLGQGTEAVLALAAATTNVNAGEVTVFVAPYDAIRSARRSEATLAFGVGDDVGGSAGAVQVPRTPNTLYLNEYAADLSDSQSSVAGHEVGHVLLVGTFAGSGDPNCPSSDPDAGAAHHPADYNMMYCAVDRGSASPNFPQQFGPEHVAGPKRLASGQQLSARCESGVPANPSACPPGEPSALNAPLLLQAPSSSSRTSAGAPVAGL